MQNLCLSWAGLSTCSILCVLVFFLLWVCFLQICFYSGGKDVWFPNSAALYQWCYCCLFFCCCYSQNSRRGYLWTKWIKNQSSHSNWFHTSFHFQWIVLRSGHVSDKECQCIWKQTMPTQLQSCSAQPYVCCLREPISFVYEVCLCINIIFSYSHLQNLKQIWLKHLRKLST